MGYYTAFTLEITPDNDDTRAAVCIAAEGLGGDGNYLSGDLVDQLLDEDADSMKWYEHNEDMVALSKAVPGVLFKLKGNGEESGDMWEAFYRDGKTYKEVLPVSFPPFDEGKLK